MLSSCSTLTLHKIQQTTNSCRRESFVHPNLSNRLTDDKGHKKRLKQYSGQKWRGGNTG